MASWRLATSLTTLRNEVNTIAPNRSKASDGTIGDPSHAARCSRHNPNNSNVVCALDLTHDPSNSADMNTIVAQILRSPHSQLTYIIWNRRVYSRSHNFVARHYTGSNPHTSHAHFAVGVGSECEPSPPYDSTDTWHLVAVTPVPAPPAPSTPGGNEVITPVLREGDANSSTVKAAQALLRLKSSNQNLTIDGIFGPGTKKSVTDFQSFYHVAGGADGIIGKNTWQALLDVGV